MKSLTPVLEAGGVDSDSRGVVLLAWTSLISAFEEGRVDLDSGGVPTGTLDLGLAVGVVFSADAPPVAALDLGGV